ncbi:molybdopterin dehydrogenase [Rhodococcus sp. 05-2255-3B1]|uniref:FAD binding domain-containing protein n=1 Tax=unclassified Rhodococcus (in: high G+C Gram-positive bacteria) TaxID=192944 RepID=UPI000B9BCC1F|nr:MULTISPECIES: xanthine dehydrogenase family protein subunit M [unclassified Rhodococcus (in: high G+C Gram-positive bacteria)]OZE15406.1 molybdopterin dehydrogenase [Rhodococcus sp. 05-2255-3B1]OZE16373.1 molybdopterin dehydrogenase [Rhodococcus sp. 05-2255-3C]OZE21128.1 molybdopterin dehydrogenase [Rhodococcus sp. 05-2255-2A2]
MKTFEYDAATAVDDAVARLAENANAMVLGGGTNLVDLMKLGVVGPTTLIDVTRLPLHDIDVSDDGSLRVGSGVTNSDLAVHPVVRQRYPVLSRAVLSGASGQLRNMATTGGNLFQRTRCVYFMDASKPCNKREPGSGCPARNGEHRNLAILGASQACVATHPSDMAVALTALDARIVVQGVDGERVVDIDDFYRLPGDAPERDNTVARDEIVTAVEIPAPAAGTVSTYRKVRDRQSYAFAIASVAATLDVEDGIVRGVSIALGGVAHKPWRARTAEHALLGAAADEASFRRAIALELDAAEPLRDNAFKVPLVTNLVARTLVELTESGDRS